MQVLLSNHWLKLFSCIILTLIVELSAAYFTQESVKTWYPTLAKPSWTPPNWVFPVVWTILYIIMAISLWLIWMERGSKLSYVFFFFQLSLNFLWSPIFFYLQNPFLGLITIGVLWIAIIATIFIFYPISKIAAYLLIPYLFWVAYAAGLNYNIWLNN